MTKFHVGASGAAAPCKARIRPCPLGDDTPHRDFNNTAEADKWAAEVLEARFGGSFANGSSTVDYAPEPVGPALSETVSEIEALAAREPNYPLPRPEFQDSSDRGFGSVMRAINREMATPEGFTRWYLHHKETGTLTSEMKDHHRALKAHALAPRVFSAPEPFAPKENTSPGEM